MKNSILTTALLLTLLSGFVMGQAGYGEISGYVYDSTGAVVPGVEISISSPDMLRSRNVTSNENGRYRLINLNPGTYTLNFRKEGYSQRTISQVAVRAGRASSLNITLEVGEFENVISIIQEAPLIDTQTTERSLNIDGEFINRLPLSPNREWTQVWSFVPGADFEGTFETSITSNTNDVSIHGASEDQNVYQLDGISMNSAFQNENNMSFTPEIISDVEIKTAGFDSSTPPGNGGYINIVTKSGGNDLSGSFSFTYQPRDWNWSNVEDGVSSEVQNYIPEATLGGPIMKDRAWFFAGYRYDDRLDGIGRTPDVLQTFDSLDLQRPTWDRTLDGHRFFLKGTFAPTDNDLLAVTFNWDRLNNRGALGFDEFSTDSALINLETGGPFFSVSYDKMWQEQFSTNVKVGYRTYESDVTPATDAEGQIIRFGSFIRLPFGIIPVFNEFALRSAPGILNNTDGKQLIVRNDNSYYVNDLYGSHNIGFGFNWRPLSEEEETATYNTFMHSGVDLYLANEIFFNGEWRIFLGNETTVPQRKLFEFGHETAGVYLQDTWQASETLSLSAGLRYQRDSDNLDGAFSNGRIGGHIGANYSLDTSGNQSVRAAYSRRQEEINGGFAISSFGGGFGGFFTHRDINLDGTFDVRTGFPFQPNQQFTAETFPLGGFSDDLRAPINDIVHLGYTRVMPANVTLDLSYNYIIRSQDVVAYDINLLWENGQVVDFINPELGRVFEHRNNDFSSDHYQSLEAVVSRNFQNNWQLFASYTWQRLERKGNWSPFEPEFHLLPESWFDFLNPGSVAPHSFSVSASAVLPWDLLFNASLRLRTGYFEAPERFVNRRPQIIQLRSGAVIDNPAANAQLFTGPRTDDRFQMDGVSNLNLGIGKQFSVDRYQITVQAQIYNVFNSGDFTNFGPTQPLVDENGMRLSERTFSSLQSPRSAQLYLKLTF